MKPLPFYIPKGWVMTHITQASSKAARRSKRCILGSFCDQPDHVLNSSFYYDFPHFCLYDSPNRDALDFHDHLTKPRQRAVSLTFIVRWAKRENDHALKGPLFLAFAFDALPSPKSRRSLIGFRHEFLLYEPRLHREEGTLWTPKGGRRGYSLFQVTGMIEEFFWH